MQTFDEWKAKNLKLEHASDCTKRHWKNPIQECPCDCYERHIWAGALTSVVTELEVEAQDWRYEAQ